MLADPLLRPRFAHDALSRVTGSTAYLASGIDLTTAYQYVLAGRRTRITHDDGFVVSYGYLVTGEMASVREGVFGDPASVMLATYDYDTRGRRIAINRTNSTTTAYAYDPISRLTSLTQNMPGTASDLTLGFENYNPAGQIGRTTRDNDSYVFDDHAAGTIPSVPNGLNQLTQVDGEALHYDPRGNLTSDASAPGGTASYTYSAENLLTSATVGGQQVTLQYDPLMRLRTTSGTATRRFVYDGVDLISEHNGPGTLVRRYVHGPGMDEPLVEYAGTDNATRRWLHADERGSIVAISDATGAAVVKNTYDEYGNPGAGNDGRFQYTGQTWIPELKLYYYKARFYDPRLGRFMQTDPIGYSEA
ncbi:RHS repeat-associated core domain-containing protein [Enterovirga sp. GCM10030262]|uniref:RHS repeat-associated core domain-containing protein n=1 Tax=Enterovirga sp. GCM10030262 TaxID=3273391 RepID=UPI003613C61F